MIVLRAKATESSMYVISASFADPDGTAFTPKTCRWSLTDLGGLVINSRTKVLVPITGSTHSFLLCGADLLFSASPTGGARVFTLEGTFDSTYGNDLPFRTECQFEVIDTVVNA
jgi:hypothetical protein